MGVIGFKFGFNFIGSIGAIGLFDLMLLRIKLRLLLVNFMGFCFELLIG